MRSCCFMLGAHVERTILYNKFILLHAYYTKDQHYRCFLWMLFASAVAFFVSAFLHTHIGVRSMLLLCWGLAHVERMAGVHVRVFLFVHLSVACDTYGGGWPCLSSLSDVLRWRLCVGCVTVHASRRLGGVIVGVWLVGEQVLLFLLLVCEGFHLWVGESECSISFLHVKRAHR